MCAALYNHFFPSETIYERIAGMRLTDGFWGVVAIDFGSTFSGYAFSFKDEYEKDVMRFHTNNWPSGTQLSSVKCPTSILFNPDKSFNSFGYEAENNFTTLCAENDETNYFFFKNFKMFLHYEKNLSSESVIFDVNKSHRTMKALVVFSESIAYLKRVAMNHIQKLRPQLHEVDLKWVVTVPAIWTERAKMFMREASEMAGIPPEALLFAIEPEAASLYCKSEQENAAYSSIGFSAFDIFSVGSSYLLVDAGGGTVDCAVHEIQVEGQVKEIYSCVGSLSGGTKVDKAFKDFLEEHVGKAVLMELCSQHPDDFFEIMRNFEVAKRIPLSQTSTVSVKVPMSVFTIYQRMVGRSLEDDINNTTTSDKVFVRRDKFLFQRQSFNEFFSGAVSEIIHVIESILSYEQCRNVKAILLVGGFSDSEILANEITGAFQDKLVIQPENKESGNAVMKGAVLYGHKPNVIVQRKARYSYGVRAFVDFIKGVDPQEYKEVINGKAVCRNYFDVLVRKGDALKVNEPQVERRYECSHTHQERIVLDLYASPLERPRYIQHPGSTFMGKIDIPLNKDKRSMVLRLYFGDTEFRCTVQQDNDTEKVCRIFDLLAD